MQPFVHIYKMSCLLHKIRKHPCYHLFALLLAFICCYCCSGNVSFIISIRSVLLCQYCVPLSFQLFTPSRLCLALFIIPFPYCIIKVSPCGLNRVSKETGTATSLTKCTWKQRNLPHHPCSYIQSASLSLQIFAKETKWSSNAFLCCPLIAEFSVASVRMREIMAFYLFIYYNYY